jgi:hypothetical protein
MPARKKKRPLRPRTPSRVKKRKRKSRARAPHQHPELIGLGLASLGLFLASLLYLGFAGGIVGEKVEQGLRDFLGGAAYAAPAALMAVGGLMLFRSALVSFTPFRVGLAVAFLGLMTTLGSSHGGFVGNLLGGWIETLLGSTGALLVGLTALLAGGLLLSGASYGALLRRSGHAMRLAHGAARRSLERPASLDVAEEEHHRLLAPAHEPPIGVVHDYPTSSRRPVRAVSGLLLDPEGETDEQTALFDAPRPEGAHVPLIARSDDVAAVAASAAPTSALRTHSSRPSRTSGSKRRSSARSPARG